MTKAEHKKFLKRWQLLCQTEQDLDYQKGLFARDLRHKFVAGDDGDQQFMRWCSDHLDLHYRQTSNLLTRANAAAALPDEESFKAVGGFSAISRVIDLPRQKQIDIITTALRQHKT